MSYITQDDSRKTRVKLKFYMTRVKKSGWSLVERQSFLQPRLCPPPAAKICIAKESCSLQSFVSLLNRAFPREANVLVAVLLSGTKE